ncbi:MAG TPA: nuclear transport factor 2 family protein [Balneolaceae bacterium]|nr:nuclear transport factor 2 family protein [Balneolaceae bacterium]
MKKLSGVLVLIVIILGCQPANKQQNSSPKAINAVLDDWHDAASKADFDRYFNHFASDSAVYMGTDATERWTVAEFKSWAKPYFDRGKAWDFTPVERHIYFADNGQTAWFDEALDTPNLGPARGTGVLVKKQGDWKIAHYNLSIPIPNAIADTVVSQVKKALQDKGE